MATLTLSGRINPEDVAGRHVLRVTRDGSLPFEQRERHVLLVSRTSSLKQQASGFPFVLASGSHRPGAIELPVDLDYLEEGDIVRLSAGVIRVVYRKTSPHNVLFVTERCNSRCVMCSQPPREIEDGYLVGEILEAIALMDPQTPQLCITGGEPTLYFEGLVEIIQAVKERLPRTALHMLSNGRLFSRRGYAKAIASLSHPEFVIGIPIYSDEPSGHDFVVQSNGAFDETLFGLLNLARYGQRVEIRFVIHRQTLPRMVETARFIARNLPFASHVALMGLEPTGFAKTNLEGLWIDPWEYQSQLEEAVEILRAARLRTSIYNHPLCLIPRALWPIAKRSISDWKNIYLKICSDCSLKAHCAGFFSSSQNVHSKHLTPFRVAS